MISHLSGFIISRFNPSPILGDLAASKCVGFFSADVAGLGCSLFAFRALRAKHIES